MICLRHLCFWFVLNSFHIYCKYTKQQNNKAKGDNVLISVEETNIIVHVNKRTKLIGENVMRMKKAYLVIPVGSGEFVDGFIMQ